MNIVQLFSLTAAPLFESGSNFWYITTNVKSLSNFQGNRLIIIVFIKAGLLYLPSLIRQYTTVYFMI
ncbi:hypothetical protein FRX31_022987, partial [Thalictrum thalictroides]